MQLADLFRLQSMNDEIREQCIVYLNVFPQILCFLARSIVTSASSVSGMTVSHIHKRILSYRICMLQKITRIWYMYILNAFQVSVLVFCKVYCMLYAGKIASLHNSGIVQLANIFILFAFLLKQSLSPKYYLRSWYSRWHGQLARFSRAQFVFVCWPRVNCIHASCVNHNYTFLGV